MFNRFAIFTLMVAVAVGMTMPGHRRAPAAAVPAPAAVPAAPPAAVAERDSPGDLTEMVVQRQPNGHFYVDGTVNGQPVHFLVDTGATEVALTSTDASRIGLQFSPGEFQQVGYGASGAVLGKSVLLGNVAVGRNEVPNVRGVILADAAGLNVSLLGQSYLEKISSVQISGDEMVIR